MIVGDPYGTFRNYGRDEEGGCFYVFIIFPWRSFSNSLAEAMASGVPCIVSDWAANKDMIENKGGIVVPIHSPFDAVEALKN